MNPQDIYPLGSCRSFGKTLASITGLEADLCLCVASHIISSIGRVPEVSPRAMRVYPGLLFWLS